MFLLLTAYYSKSGIEIAATVETANTKHYSHHAQRQRCGLAPSINLSFWDYFSHLYLILYFINEGQVAYRVETAY